jgi:3-oxoacyl-[acyl-carrier-protein] synthase-3
MYVPSEVLTNDDLASMVDTSDDWIQARTGIVERRIAPPSETTATMSIRAARTALQVANANPARLDLIIVATATPDYPFPATACLVQDALGATRAGAFDLSAGCTGFVYALAVGSQMIISGAYDQVMVIGAETLSRIINWTDRNTCVLFGDGAGAVLLQASDVPGGVLSAVLGSDGSGGDLLMLPAGGSRHPASLETVAQDMHYIYMNGPEVFRFATRVTAKAAKQALAEANVNLEDISLFISHQANGRIIQSASKSLKLPPEKVFVNLDRYGNTSSASVPIALCEAIEQGRVKRDDHLVIVGFGAGLTWAATVIRWGVPLPVSRLPRWRVAWRLARYRWAAIRSSLRRLGWKILSAVMGLFVRDNNGSD